MLIRKYFLLFCTLLAIMSTADAQSGTVKRGDAAYQNMAYPAAIRAYRKALKKTEDPAVMERLADSYRLTGNTADAELWYGKASASKPALNLRYGQMLQSNGKYAEAQKAFEAYKRTGENPMLAQQYIDACSNAGKFMADSARYTVSKLAFNGKASDFGGSSYLNGVIFSSARRRGFCSYFRNVRNDNYFYDLYFAENPLPGAKAGKPKLLKGKVNSKLHDGPALVDRNGIMYFTRSNAKPDGKGIIHLKIYSAKLSGKKWKEVTPLSFNNNAYSCGHPALSADGNTMVFASNMPGGKGGSDLYIVRKTGEAWGTPQNLGDYINTAGEEKFPFLHPSGTLFFSSDGLPGLGGMDLFSADPTPDGLWGLPMNCGYPLNSSKDDFSLAWTGSQNQGYFSSNRKDGAGDDDVYAFTRKSSMTVQVADARTHTPLPGVKISVLDENNKTTEYVTNEKGEFTHTVTFNKEYFVSASLDKYLPSRKKISTKELNPVKDLRAEMVMEPDIRFVVTGTVTDDSTGAPLAGGMVRLVGPITEKQLARDANGGYTSGLEENSDYTLVVMHEGYVPQIFSVSTKGVKPQEFKVNARLKKGNFILCEGTVLNQTTSSPLEGSNVRAVDMDSRKELGSFVTTSNGKYFLVLDPKVQQMVIAGSRRDFFSRRAEVTRPKVQKDTTLVANLELVPAKIGEMVKIIYYDYNLSIIRKDAGLDLIEIIYFLLDNPAAAVELSSHTDSRAGNEYNQKLSQERADAAVKYITQSGVPPAQISAKGYGESKLTNKCTDGVECDENMHSMNRRTEIRVVSLDGVVPGK